MAPPVVVVQILAGAGHHGSGLPAVAFGRLGQFGLQLGDAAPALLVILPVFLHQIAEGLRQSLGGLVVHGGCPASCG